MPGETIRNCVGRYSGATLDDEELGREDLVPENNKNKEGACRRWLRKICPCCCRKASKEPDAIDGIELTVGPDDHKEKLPAEPHETNGEVVNAVLQRWSSCIPRNTTFSHPLSHCFRKSFIGAGYRPHQVQKR